LIHPFSFDPSAGSIIVKAVLIGPKRPVVIDLVLDTGSTHTLIRPDALLAAGYDPLKTQDPTAFTTVTGVETIGFVIIARLEALGFATESLPVVAHDLPHDAQFDGLLGLDFFRDRNVVLDFRAGHITLT